jgi:hypothetical protein
MIVLSGLLIHTCGLSGSKPTTIHSVIDVRVHVLVGRINLRAQWRGVQVQRGIASKVIKLRIKHSNYLCAFVVYDGALDLVPEHRDCGAARVFGIGDKVELFDCGGVVDWVTCVNSSLILFVLLRFSSFLASIPSLFYLAFSKSP